MTTLKFFYKDDLPTFSGSYDLGWNKGLDMGGAGGYEAQMVPQDNLTRVMFRNLRDSKDYLFVYWAKGKVSIFIPENQSKFKVVKINQTEITIEAECQFISAVERGEMIV